ncbi:serine hydrolase [Temperatibacter marinus]|uniref:Serine hydrolase n=1 Tax=Temperatibacter marinus TaxID=1456591 RepID=A0AA52EIF9_9PROT|nr:serine hydrolase [Temperatibacter marinus]WND02636.1 serine hydrolase [Temperatibacter marinus]
MAGKIGKLSLGLIIILGVIWVAIGPDWRAFVANPPLNKDVLFWTEKQRDIGFRMIDRIDFIVKSRVIKAGTKTMALNAGKPLPSGLDVEAYMKANSVSGLVVLQDGQLRLEKYGLDFSSDGRWTSFSVAKSLTSTLVGAAIKDGYIKSLDANVADYIEGLKGSAYDGVTIEQLLTMSSGVAWNEDYSDPKSDVAQYGLHVPDDGFNPIVSYMRKLPRAHPAGDVWNYSSGETNMIGILVTEATGKILSDYASEKIWAVYGMEADATWLLDGEGEEISGCCIQASTRDFARLGQFIMDGAKVEGQSIVPEDWMSLATQRHFDLNGRSYGYGYQWWIYENGAFGARGIFGQSIYIDPKRNLVIATNSNWDDARGSSKGQNARRDAFHQSVVDLIDAESHKESSD